MISRARENELIRRWKQGDDAAGHVLLDRHYEAIVAFARKKRWREPEDVAQQTALSTIESIHRFRGSASLRTYILHIAQNIALSRERRNARERPTADIEGDASPGVAAAVDEHLTEYARALPSAMQSLPGSLQQVLHLSFWQGLTQAEIADVLALPSGTVASRLRRAKAALRQALSDIETGRSRSAP